MGIQTFPSEGKRVFQISCFYFLHLTFSHFPHCFPWVSMFCSVQCTQHLADCLTSSGFSLICGMSGMSGKSLHLLASLGTAQANLLPFSRGSLHFKIRIYLKSYLLIRAVPKFLKSVESIATQSSTCFQVFSHCSLVVSWSKSFFLTPTRVSGLGGQCLSSRYISLCASHYILPI